MILNNFTDTRLGLIPSDWKIKNIKSLSEVIIDNRGKTPPLANDGLYLIEAKQIYMESRFPKVGIDSQKYVDNNTYENWFRSGHPIENDILFTTVGNIASTAIIPYSVNYCIAQNIIAIRFNKLIKPKYALYYSKSHFFRKEINKVVMNAVQPSLKVPHLLKILIPLPPLPEQQKIAEILSTIDEVIEKTSDIIEETQQLKKGLMQKLFTEGIGHTRFKETKIGRIPEEWEIVTLIDFSLDGVNNGVFNDPKNVGKGYKLVNVVNMYSGSSINVEDLTLLGLEQNEFKRNQVCYGDIFFTRSSLVREGIGFCNIFLGHDDDVTFDGHLMRIRPNNEIVSPLYLRDYCSSSFARKYLIRMGKTTTMTTLSQKDLGKLPVMLPSYEEQKGIVSILSEVDAKIEKEEATKAELKQLKKGLMQVLLTGKVRVKA